MKNNYIISAQFVKPNKKFEEEIKKHIKNAVENYNSKSLMAKNPKQIVDYSYSMDDCTLIIELESEAELPMPTKALRIFSTYLVDFLNEDYFAGKQLFKMTATNSLEKPQHFAINETKEITLSVEDFAKLDTDEKLIELYKLLTNK